VRAGADSTQGLTPACIDWAAWPAIAGDHSCSSAQMLATAREAPWILGVADVAAQLKVDLARIAATAPARRTPRESVSCDDGSRRNPFAPRAPARARPTLRLQRTDPEYATRAARTMRTSFAAAEDRCHPDDYAALVLRPARHQCDRCTPPST
jgi:hypothetical protein